MNLFLDSEFTGLRKDTTLISLGIESQDGRSFYAEFNDYDTTQVDSWLQTNVIDNLLMSPPPPDEDEYYMATRGLNHVGNLFNNYSVKLRGDKKLIRKELEAWLSQFGEENSVTIISDCLAYDWVLFCDLFGGAFGVPKQVYYIPIDLCTILYMKGLDPDTNREELANLSGPKHNALHDARVIKASYLNLMKP